MKTIGTLILCLALVIGYQEWRLMLLKWQQDARLRDDFVIQLLHEIRDGRVEQLERLGVSASLATVAWRSEMQGTFVMSRDTYASTTEHIILFPSGLTLAMETGELTRRDGTTAQFEIAKKPRPVSDPYPTDTDTLIGRFYLNGPHRVYLH